jgi:hypothetical protein
MPLVDGQRVILSDACGNAVALQLADGAVAWSHRRNDDCSEGGAGVLFGGRVFTPLGGWTYDAVTGADRGRLPGGAPDAVAGALGFRLSDGLRAVSLSTGKQRWHRGTGQSYAFEPLRPIVAGPTLFGTTSDAHLVGVDRETGELLSRRRLPWANPGNSYGTRPGMSVGHGILVATAGGRLTAFAPVLVPKAHGTDAAASLYYMQAGKRVNVVGGLGRKVEPRGNRRVAMERDAYPFGHFGHPERSQTLADGTAYYSYLPLRNTRYRLRLIGTKAPARAITVYAYPFQKHRIRRVGRDHVEVRVSMKADSGFHGGGHDLIVYWWRHGAKRIFRVGSGRIRQTGTGRAHVAVVFRRPSHTRRRDRIFWCIRGLHGYGRYDPHCGDSSERY